jgi:hypothetical protein
VRAIRTQIVAACGGFAVLALSGVAVAQSTDPLADGPGVPLSQVDTVVRSTGLAPVGPPVRRGASYVVIAANRSGEPIRVVVDARTGSIQRILPIRSPQVYGMHPVPPADIGRVPVHPTSANVGPLVPPREIGLTPPASVPVPAPVAGDPVRSSPATGPLARDPVRQQPAVVSAALGPVRPPLPRSRPAIASGLAAGELSTGSIAPQPQRVAKPQAAENPEDNGPAPRSSAASVPTAETVLVPVAPLD